MIAKGTPRRVQIVPEKEDPFESRLQALVQREPDSVPIIGAALKLAGSDEARAAPAASWSQIKDRTRQLAEAELQSRLGPGGFYSVRSDAMILICFAECGLAEAEQKVQLVAERIRESLVKEFPAVRDKIRLDPFAASVERSALRLAGGNLADRLSTALQELKRKAGRIAEGGSYQLAQRTNLLFAPCWSRSRNVLAFNRCILDVAGQDRGSETEMDGDNDARAPLEFDRLVLAKAVKKLQFMMGGGRLSPLLVPVRYRTVSNAADLRSYLELIQSMEETCSRFLVLQIFDIPAAPAAPSVLEGARNLAPWVKWISLSFKPTDPRIPDCAKAPIWALAVDLIGTRSTDGALHSQLRRLNAIAAAAKINTFAHGVNSIGLALAGVKAGITYMDGSAIHPLANEPRALGPLKPMLSALATSRL